MLDECWYSGTAMALHSNHPQWSGLMPWESPSRALNTNPCWIRLRNYLRPTSRTYCTLHRHIPTYMSVDYLFVSLFGAAPCCGRTIELIYKLYPSKYSRELAETLQHCAKTEIHCREQSIPYCHVRRLVAT